VSTPTPPRVVRAISVRVGWRAGEERLTNRYVRTVLEGLAQVLADEARAGRRVHVPGIGVFRPHVQRARTVRLPSGQLSKSKPRVVVKFRAAGALRLEAK
jgi:nucleoid DNA-binding protein